MKYPYKSKASVGKYTWNLELLYASPDDPRIERDIRHLEASASKFAVDYDVPHKTYLKNPISLQRALRAYEKLMEEYNGKFLMYFCFLRDTDASSSVATSKLSLIENRLAHVDNKITFFRIALGSIPVAKQKTFLHTAILSRYKILLSRIFSDAKHDLSILEEKIMNLKSLPSYTMWVSGNEKILNQKSVTWKNKPIPLAKALSLVSQLKTQGERLRLSKAISQTLKTVAPFSEAEMSAIVTNKKINDQLRGYKKPYENTVLVYRNDPAVVERLVNLVTKNFKIAHSFYEIKAKLLKQKKLIYADRMAKIGIVKKKFDFENTISVLKETFGRMDMKYPQIISKFIGEGRIDAYPRIGKASGAYCWGSYGVPTYILLNHNDTLNSFTTVAHELGHAFHTELSASQGALYSDYSTALAETASTLFEAIALESVYDKLSDNEKIIVLHDKINDDIATVFRQIACFNFENEIHTTIRNQGFMSHIELAKLHNKHMGAYLGNLFKLNDDDGYYFVHWSHIRRFFYVYSYAFGQLVSKALLRQYKKDKNFWGSIEKFLSAGGKDSPENILKEIGIDVTKPNFFMEGLREIEDDIKKLQKLVAKK